MANRQFTPVVKFVEEHDPDRLAVSAIHAMHLQVKATMDTERSRKTTIGVSEIGDPCTRCVVRKLSGLYEKPQSTFSDGWKAQVGTFVHAGLEEHFGKLVGLEVGETKLQVKLEQRVLLLDDPRLRLDGSCDFFVYDKPLSEGGTFGMVSDWKIQGPKVIADTQAGKVKPVYEVQGDGYGLGWELLGFPVTHVCLFALPRDGELSAAAPVVRRYNRQNAVDALARITSLLDARDVLEQAFPGEGWDRLIRAQDTASGCFTCRAYETQESSGFFGDWLHS